MTDLPILFSAPMVRALLAGTKTQTRRVLTLRGHKSFCEFGPSDTAGYDWHFRDAALRWHDLRQSELLGRLRFAVGDRLWVKEAWRTVRQHDHLRPSELTPGWTIQYLTERPFETPVPLGVDDGPALVGKNRLRRYMCRWMSRLTLHITDVRVQRLQDISEADAVSEGVECIEPTAGAFNGGWRFYTKPPSPDAMWSSARDSYLDLWKSINGPILGNPWIVALSFSVERCNIDQASAT